MRLHIISGNLFGVRSLRSPAICLLIALVLGVTLIGRAQSAYNRLYTLQAHAATFDAVAPHGNFGGCIAAATVIDSSTGKQAIRICRVNASGNIEASHYYNVPDDTARMIYVNYKAITRVHDNCYALVGTVLPKYKQYGFIMLSDSNGMVYRYRDIIFSDSFNYLSDVNYDGGMHLIVGGKRLTSSTSDLIIGKFDTALNQVWIKSYHPRSLFGDQFMQNLMIDNSGYTLCGGAQNSTLDFEKTYGCQAVLFKTDTTGSEQWIWTSRTSTYSDYQSPIGAALHTQDGGYIYTTMGHTYNRLLPSDPGIRLDAKLLIVKLDAARNKQWEIVLDDYYVGFGYVRNNLLALSDSTFIFLGSRTTDSISPDLKMGKLVLELYTNKGILLRKRIINKYLPRSADDTHKESGGPVYDIRQTADKGLVLCGYYENRTAGAPAPTQRAWLLKLDSNWCLGAGDSQCIPSAVIEFSPDSDADFIVRPNPNKGTCTLSCTSGSQAIVGAHVQIFDLNGRTLLQQTLRGAETQLDLSLFAPGVYFYQISRKDRLLFYGKLVKE